MSKGESTTEFSDAPEASTAGVGSAAATPSSVGFESTGESVEGLPASAEVPKMSGASLVVPLDGFSPFSEDPLDDSDAPPLPTASPRMSTPPLPPSEESALFSTASSAANASSCAINRSSPSSNSRTSSAWTSAIACSSSKERARGLPPLPPTMFSRNFVPIFLSLLAGDLDDFFIILRRD